MEFLLTYLRRKLFLVDFMRGSLENSILPLKDPNMRKEVSPKENYYFSFSTHLSNNPFDVLMY